MLVAHNLDAVLKLVEGFNCDSAGWPKRIMGGKLFVCEIKEVISKINNVGAKVMKVSWLSVRKIERSWRFLRHCRCNLDVSSLRSVFLYFASVK